MSQPRTSHFSDRGSRVNPHTMTTIKAATQAVEYLIVGLGGEIDRLCIHVEIGVLSVLSVAKISIPREKKEKYWKNRPQSIPVSVQIV